MLKKPWLWMGMFVFLLVACGRSATSAPVVVTDDANGTTVTLQPGQTLVVRLAANPTTGYLWQIAEVDRAVLRPLGEEAGYTPQASDGARLGAGGTAEWRFEAVGQGTTVLTLHYLRPWEADAAPARTFTLTVKIAP